MNDLFAPPDNAWQPVSPKLRTMRRIVLVIWTAIFALAVFTTNAAVELVLGDLVDVPGWLEAGAYAVLLAIAVAAWFAIGRNARMWGYAERDEELYVKHGALFRELVAVPYGRMQFVDVTAGPLQQMFGIATVHLHTAAPGTNARIPGLPPEEAARLRDRLTERGESQAAGL